MYFQLNRKMKSQDIIITESGQIYCGRLSVVCYFEDRIEDNWICETCPLNDILHRFHQKLLQA